MFTRIHLQNFRSFGDITLDLTAKNSKPRHLAVIYGENGAGKSNITSAFVLLKELMSTMDVRDMYADFLSQKAIFADESMQNMLQTKFRSGMRDIQAIIDDVHMVGSDEPIIAEYEFSINGHLGVYTVALGKAEIIYEKLEYLLNKRRGTYFECTESKIYINAALTKDNDFQKDIKESVKRFWGKHSMFAILDHEIRDKSKAYGYDNISENLRRVLFEINLISCYTNIGTRKWDQISAPLEILESADKGRLHISNEKQLDVAEKIFTEFFTAINSDIRTVFYQRSYTDQYVSYELAFDKYIAGKYRTIEFSRESSGNHQLLRILCYLLCACFGGIAVIDEADSGIHDWLFYKLAKEINKSILGQVIMTSHNTLLMETDFARDSTYILSEDDECNKIIRAVSDYPQRTYINNNVRKKYMDNEYGGLPKVKSIDFDAILSAIREKIIE